jgi:hypothetical protein
MDRRAQFAAGHLKIKKRSYYTVIQYDQVMSITATTIP